jgi:Sulfotransferase family
VHPHLLPVAQGWGGGGYLWLIAALAGLVLIRRFRAVGPHAPSLRRRPRSRDGIERPIVISVHIPKCGGFSFQRVLLRIYGKKGVWLNYGPAISSPTQARCDPIPPGVRCIHGHFMSNAFDTCATPFELVTWLRHPVERVISNYYHFLRHPDQNPCCRELFDKRLSLEQFAELDLMRNEMTRYLAGKPVEAFRFIGILEEFEESLKAFGAVFGIQVPAAPPRENVNPDRITENYRVPDRTYQHILALNGRDLMTYNLAMARLGYGGAEQWSTRATDCLSNLSGYSKVS